MKQALIMLIVCVIAGSAEAGPAATQRDRPAPGSRVHKLEELTWPQIDAFDRQRTLFILPVGMIEQHGPHLPVGADTIGVTYEANGASTRVSRALPDWNVVMMPAVNYGQSGANQLGDRPIHPGTYAIRMDVHAGVGETSGILAIRPDLVPPNYKTLPSQAGRSLEELRTAPGWQGYLSSPARATAAHGQAVEAWWIDGSTDLILRAVRGENMFVHARVPETVPAAMAPILEKELADEAAFGATLENWLAQRSKR